MKIGLFPLNLVLFPQSIYPLHIFEDGYKNLINKCIEDKSEFGIILTNGEEMAEIGCTARVYSLMKKYSDGRMDISVIGCDKFRINDYSVGENLYLESDVEIIKEMAEETDEKLLENCIELFNFITNKIPVFRVQQTTKEELTSKYASYFFAQKAGLIPKQKQSLLEMKSENERLTYIQEHLQRIKPSVSKAIEIEKIVRNDGYLAPRDMK